MLSVGRGRWGKSPLFHVAFNHKPRRDAALDFGEGLAATETPLDPGVAPFDLTLVVDEAGDESPATWSMPVSSSSPAECGGWPAITACCSRACFVIRTGLSASCPSWERRSCAELAGLERYAE